MWPFKLFLLLSMLLSWMPYDSVGLSLEEIEEEEESEELAA